MNFYTFKRNQGQFVFMSVNMTAEYKLTDKSRGTPTTNILPQHS